MKSRQVDYVQEFPKTPLQENIYIRIPSRFFFKDSYKKEHVLKLNINVYGLKQAAFNWNELLTSGILTIVLHQSKSDPCLFLNSQIICVIYVYDTIVFSNNNSTIEKEHQSTQRKL